MKQLVTETRHSKMNINVTTSYPETHSVFSKREREEVVDGIYTYYWIEVANPPVIDPNLEPTKYYSHKTAKKLAKIETKKELRQLKQEKKARIAKYRAYVESIYYSKDKAVQRVPKKDRHYDFFEVITDEDIVSGTRLAELIGIGGLSKLGEQKQNIPSLEKFMQISEKVINPKGNKDER